MIATEYKRSIDEKGSFKFKRQRVWQVKADMRILMIGIFGVSYELSC